MKYDNYIKKESLEKSAENIVKKLGGEAEKTMERAAKAATSTERNETAPEQQAITEIEEAGKEVGGKLLNEGKKLMKEALAEKKRPTENAVLNTGAKIPARHSPKETEAISKPEITSKTTRPEQSFAPPTQSHGDRADLKVRRGEDHNNLSTVSEKLEGREEEAVKAQYTDPIKTNVRDTYIDGRAMVTTTPDFKKNGGEKEDPALHTKTGTSSGFSRNGKRQEEKKNEGTKTSLRSREQERTDSPASLRTKKTDSSLKSGGESGLKTAEGSSAVQGLQNEGASLATASEHGAQAIKTASEEIGKASMEAAGQAGASAAAGAASGGITVAVQAATKIADKIKETVQTAVSERRGNGAKFGLGTALLLLPMIFMIVAASIINGSGTASNKDLSDAVLALMPKIQAACSKYDIPEYVPLVAAVMMQESGGNAELVNGDVMQCAEGMGYPVHTPVPVEESIDFGTGLLAGYLRQANSQGPDDIAAISLALQSYNFGGGFLLWAQQRGGYSKSNAAEFAALQAAAMGWSSYGDEDYVDHVLRYYQIDSFGFLTGDSKIEAGFFAYPCTGHSWHTYSGHEGIDISWSGCYGEPVYAVADGTVSYTYTGWTAADGKSGLRSYGNTVFINHANGWQSRYGHMSSVVVSPGEFVTQGQLLGYIGSTGNSTGPHLHLALYDTTGNPRSGSQNWAEIAWPQYH